MSLRFNEESLELIIVKPDGMDRPMAESKKTSDKAKNTRRKSPSTGTKHNVIDGNSIDKPVPIDAPTASLDTSRPADINAKQPRNGKPKSWVAGWTRQLSPLLSQSAAIVVSGVAVLVALLSLAVSLAVYWQAADLAEVKKLGVAMPESGYADPNIISDRYDRLTALVKQNSEQYASLAQDINSALELDSPIVNNLIDRLTALEIGLDSQNMVLPAATPAAPNEVRASSQIGLLVAAGLLAENLAGRHLGTWVSLLNEGQWHGVAAQDLEIFRTASEIPVRSRADLLSLGRLQLTPLEQSLNKREDASGLFDRIRNRLADLVKLRRIDAGASQPTTLLAAFETGLDQADFDAAFAAATIWSASGFVGLESWLAEARRRQDLDAAVNRLVTIFVRRAIGQS